MIDRWAQGHEVIDRLLAEGWLEHIPPNRTPADEYLYQATSPSATSRLAAATDAVEEFQLVYDATRKELAAVLVNQGLRPTSRGGHIVGERTALAQLGASLRETIRPFSWMRPLRNDSEYPSADRPVASAEDATEARRATANMVVTAKRLPDGMRSYCVRGLQRL